jgi:hypothetical protein
VDTSDKRCVNLFWGQVSLSLRRSNQPYAGNKFGSCLQKGRRRYQDGKGSGDLLSSDNMEGDSG